LESYLSLVESKHINCLSTLPLDSSTSTALSTKMKNDLQDIRDILRTVSLLKWNASRISDLVAGYGETWSAQILCALLSHRSTLTEHTFLYLDARRVITINEEKDGKSFFVEWNMSQEKLQKVYEQDVLSSIGKEKKVHFVITGFVASNTQNVPTTLQRDGSDYSAAIFGRLFLSQGITIWTDVNGVMSADPRRVPSSYTLTEVSFKEAMELAYFGAKVMHPKTMLPASITPPIPLYIRNTFQPSFPGTRIYTSSATHSNRDKCVCGFSSIDSMALINVEGSGMVGIPGVAKRLFGTLESKGVNVVLISQASSEHSITFATTLEMAEVAKEGIEEEFRREIENNHISTVEIQKPCSIIAAVGDGMPTTTGVSGRFFTALGDAKISVLAISQGSSARNISAVVYTSESTRALRAVHAAFRLSHTSVRVGVIGMNEVGLSLLKLLEEQRNKLRSRFEIDLMVVALMKDGMEEKEEEENGRIVTLKEDGEKHNGDLDWNTCSITMEVYQSLTTSTEATSDNTVAKFTPGDLSTFPQHVLSPDCAHNIIFDCTGETNVGQYHATWLKSGVHVITANSTGLSGPIKQRNAIDAVLNQHGRNVSYLREVTVGGALPVVRTLHDLLYSGDCVHFVDGILSVSMSYILYRIAPPPGAKAGNVFDEHSSNGAFQGVSFETPCLFSEAVKEAVDLGLMETDPRRDLSNEYTARVLMVLAKELDDLDKCYDVEKIQDSSDQLFLDDECNDINALYTKVNALMKERVESAAEKGCVPRHVSSIDVKAGTIEVKIVDVPLNHVFAITPPSCECVRFFTERHRSYPLIIQGPSAGADSTASALLAELVNLMRNKVSPKSGTILRTTSADLANVV